MPIPPDPLVYYEGYSLLIILLTVMAVITSIGFWVGRDRLIEKYGSDRAQGFIRLSFAATIVGLGATLWSLFLDAPRPRISLDTRGITCHRLNDDKIEWRFVTNLIVEYVPSRGIGGNYVFRIYLTPSAPRVRAETSGQGWRMASCRVNSFSSSSEESAYANVYWRRATGRP